MALDSKLSQTINVRANGDAMLRPLKAMGNELNRLIEKMQQVANPSTAKGRAELTKLTKEANGALRTISQLNDLMNAGSRTGRAKTGLMAGLTDQNFGKQVLNASKLKLELDKTTKASEALEVRLGQLYKKFNDLGNAGKAVGKRDIAKALNTQEALKQVQALEREIARLDGRNNSRGGLTGDAANLRAQLGTTASTLLTRAQNGRRTDFTKEIGELAVLVDGYKKVTREIEQTATASQRAASQRRSAIMDTINMNEAQLRAQVGRAAAGYKFTPEQARQTNLPLLNAQLEQGYQRLGQFQLAMSKAVAQGRSSAVIDRLAKSFENLKQKIGEAEAQKKAFDALPEQRMKSLTSSLFADGGLAFGTRIAGASLLTAGIFGVINAAKSSAQYVVQLEDAFARLQAIAGATDTEMGQLSSRIIELGTNSRYSTLEIAEAATQIVQAGYSAAEAGDVLQASLQLAAGSGSTVAEGVDTMTSSLGAFQLQATESSHVADVLMEGLNRSKLSINQMQAALQYAGATAHETGMSLEELVAIAGSLANAGIKSGSTIGTGVRQLLVDLQTPSEKFQKELKSLGLTMADVDIRGKSLADIVKLLTERGFSAEAAYESFEVRAASAFLAFRNQIDVYDEMAQALTQTGAAAEANAKAMDSLSAKWTQTKNTLGELLTMLSEPFVNILKMTLDAVNGLIGGIMEFTKGLGELLGMGTEVGGMLSGALLPALLGFALGGPMGAVVGGLLGFIASLKDASDASDELAAATDKSQQELSASRQTVTSVDEAIDRLIMRGEGLKKNHQALQVEVLNLSGKFEGLASQIDTTKMSYEGLMEAMVRYRGLKLQEEGEKARETIINSQKEGGPVLGQLKGNTNALATQLNNFRKMGPEQFRNSAAVVKAQTYINSVRNTNYGQLGGSGLLADQVNIRGLINDLRELGEGNAYIDAIIKNLEARLTKVQKVGELRGNITTAQMTQGLVEEINSPGGQQRDSFLLKTRSSITDGLNKNKAQKGSGDSILATANNQADVQLRNMRNELAKVPADSAKARAITQSIADLEAEVARITRQSDRDTEKMMKDEKAGAGEVLTGTQVRPLIENEFKGSKVTSWGKRSYATQLAAYRRYKAGTGPLAAKPGRSNHGSDHAIDMMPIRGMNIDQVAAFLESKGLEITERLVEPHPGGGVHWHLAWKAKSSRFQQNLDRAQDKDAKELQDLLEAQAGNEQDTAQKRIERIIAEGKAGIAPVSDLHTQFNQAAIDYANASLHEFDVKNPTSGLSATALKTRELARKALEEKLKEDVKKYFADFYRAVGDHTIDVMNQALEESQRVLNDALRAADQISREAERQINIAGNRVNRGNVGDGTSYVLGRRKEAADDQAAQLKINATRAKIYDDSLKISAAEATVNALPEGDDKTAKLAEIAAAWEKIRETVEATNQAQQDLNDKYAVLSNMPIKERLEGAAQAWMENNGAMDTWAKRAENFVGPALDNIKGGLTDMFASLMDGSKTWKQALGDMLKSFAKFVIQYIAECLAMLAITTLMKALGVPIPPSMQFGGGKFGGGPAGGGDSAPAGVVGPRFNGGPTGPIGSRYNGGTVNQLWGGGGVRTGVSNRDSSLYELAHGEYVVRNKSVREIGLDGMDQINKHGAKGLARLKGANVMQNFQLPKQETNVFVVKPDSQPAMGPNDVLVTIHEDILQGGATKKLIKQVAQGA